MTATKVNGYSDYSFEVLDPDYEWLTEKANVVGSARFLETLPGYEQVHLVSLDIPPTTRARPSAKRAATRASIPLQALVAFSLIGYAQVRSDLTIVHPILLVPIILIALGFSLTALLQFASLRPGTD